MASASDATALIRDLELYLARLIQVVDGGSPSENRAAPTTAGGSYNWGASKGTGPATTRAAWLEGPPPDTGSEPAAQPNHNRTVGQPNSDGAAAQQFLKELEQLIKTFLSHQQGTASNATERPAPISGSHRDIPLETTQRPAPYGGSHRDVQVQTTQRPAPYAGSHRDIPLETTQRPAPYAGSHRDVHEATPARGNGLGGYQWHQAAEMPLDPFGGTHRDVPAYTEAESRVDVLRRAVAAAEADAAAKELSRLPSQNIMQQIDHQWDAALSENNQLKAQLGQASQQQEHLWQAKNSADQLVREKELLLGKIREAILDLKYELSRHKFNLEQQRHTATRAAPEPPNDEKQVLIDRLKHGVSDLEDHLQRMQGEKRGLEADLQRTHGEKRGLEYQLENIHGEKRGLEADLERTYSALQTHQNLKQTLDQSFLNTETEMQALRQLLQQLEVDRLPPGSAFQQPRPAPYTGTHRDVGVTPRPVGYTGTHRDVGVTPRPVGYTGTHRDVAFEMNPRPVPYTGSHRDAPGVNPRSVPYTGSHRDVPALYGGTHRDLPFEMTQRPAPYTGSHRGTRVETVDSEPAPAPGNSGLYEYQQNQAPWQEPVRHTVYHVETPSGQELLARNELMMMQQQQQQQQLFDPPAYVASPDGSDSQQQQPWGPSDPAALNGTGSVGYSSTGASAASASLEGARHYPQRAQQYYPTGQQHPWTAQESAWSENGSRGTPQEPPPMSPVSEMEQPSVGPMAFLQEKMANAVDDARNNPTKPSSFSYASKPPMKLPLQPAPLRVPSPESAVPPNQAYGKPPVGYWR